MESERILYTIDTHTMGEPTRVLYTPLPELFGLSMAEKKKKLQDELDFIRTTLMNEPRGHREMFGAMITEPASKDSDLGLLFMDGKGYLDMCIHGSMGAVRSALEIGIVKGTEPLTRISLDTPAGNVTAEIELKGSRVQGITIENVPSFLYMGDLHLDLEGIGSISVDIAFGGNFFALVEAEALGLELTLQNLRDLVERALLVREKVNQAVQVVHPLLPHLNSVGLVVVHTCSPEGETHRRNVTVFGAGQVDRSPCGTGTSALMSAMYAKGMLSIGEPFTNESIIGTRFQGVLVRDTKVGTVEAVIPKVRGNAYIIGVNQWIIAPDDPLKYGFTLGQGA